MSNRRCLFAFALLFPALGGCSLSSASGQVADVRLGYNEAIARSGNEQLLLNIVRLRYLHSPQFFEVASVTTQSAVRTGGSLGVTGNFGNNLSESSIFTPWVTAVAGAEVSVEDRPTVQYAPLSGEAFAQRLVTPIRPDTLLMLAEVGWRIDRLLTACVQRINDLSAPVIASDSDTFGGEEFRRVADALYQLQIHQALEVGIAGSGDARRLVLGIVTPPEGPLHEIAMEVRQILRLDPNLSAYPVVGSHLRLADGHVAATTETAVEEPVAEEGGPATDNEEAYGQAGPVPETSSAGDRIVLRGRSLLGALFYLSHGVEVEPSDSSARPLDYTDVEGRPVAVPSPLPEALLRVRRSTEVPTDSFVATRYRGHWYSISDLDLDSKGNLLLLNILFSVLSNSDRGAPVLTIPVGG